MQGTVMYKLLLDVQMTRDHGNMLVNYHTNGPCVIFDVIGCCWFEQELGCKLGCRCPDFTRGARAPSLEFNINWPGKSQNANTSRHT